MGVQRAKTVGLYLEKGMYLTKDRGSKPTEVGSCSSVSL